MRAEAGEEAALRVLPRNSRKLKDYVLRIKGKTVKGTTRTVRAPAKERLKEGEERRGRNKESTPSTGHAVSLPQTKSGSADPNTRLVNWEPPTRCEK